MNVMNNIESQDEPKPQGTGFMRTCFNGLNALTGIGILSIPYALSEGGWISLTALFGMAIICFYTGLLLKRCMDADPLIRTYPDIGARAFGHKGRAVISTFLYLELFLLAVEFLILEGDCLHKLFPDAHILGRRFGGERAFILLTAFVILPTTWLRNLSLLAYVSLGGILASIILTVAVFWIGAFEGVGFQEKGVLWRFNGLPIAISMYTFCYCGHTVFPTLCASMTNKNHFPKVLLVCFILSTISYGSMAALGYLMYGENLMSQVTLNLPTHRISSKIAIYTTIVNPITKYAIMVAPIATAIEETLIHHNCRPFRLIVRTILVTCTVIVALFIPFFGYVMAFIGAFLGVACSVLFPCICYLKINNESRRFGVELAFILVILVLGFFIGATGTFTSLRDIVKHAHTNE